MTEKNTLWVFGDSFAAKSPDAGHSFWWGMVAQHFGMEARNAAFGATGIEYAIKNYHNSLINFKKNDIIIIALSELSRRWIMKNYPGYSAAGLLKYTFVVNEIADDELPGILRILEDPNKELIMAETEIFLDAVEAHQKRIGLTVLVMPCFGDTMERCNLSRDTFIKTKGHLSNIAISELYDNNSVMWLKKNKDTRSNHIWDDNHTILAKKIIDSIENGAILDLTTGFKEDFVTKKMLQSIKK
jgi:hypothetical protein